jgi:cysteinyl-tRNA synthetase
MTQIKFYNSLTHRTDVFQPADPLAITMYNCGPTVYDYAHIGNFRTFIFADVLRRFLDLVYGPGSVRQVMNLTDVGHMTEDQLADGGGQDKMQVAIQRVKEAKKSGRLPADALADPNDPYQVANFYIQEFLVDARSLGIKVASEHDRDPAKSHMPQATNHIDDMKAMIQQLLDRKHAYVASDQAVYYDVQSFQGYGNLSGNSLEHLAVGKGGRVLDEHQAVKHHPADFLLWKPDQTHLMKWDSPWGTGYPGWHIECSAMALAVLSRITGKTLTTIDIHTGGEDNIFPHHECEIAQACGCTGQAEFARFWMHSRHLLVEGQKMAKSKNNFYTLGDLMDRGAESSWVRYELMRGHYRSNLNFTFKGLEDARKAVAKIRDFSAALVAESDDQATVEIDASHPILGSFIAALADDLNMSEALGVVFSWIGQPQSDKAEALAVIRKIDNVLGLGLGLPDSFANIHSPDQESSGQESGSEASDGIRAKCAAIDTARAQKDFATADQLRQKLIDAGYEVTTDKATGTAARKKLT